MSAAADPEVTRPAAGMRYVGIAVIPRRRRPIEKALGRVVECGGEALLITADGSSTPMYAGVQHIDLLDAETRLGLNRVIAVSPKRVAGRLVGRRVPGRSLAWRTWHGSRPYKAVRFYLLARLLRSRTEEVRPQDVTNILLAGVESWPIAWQLTQVRPDIEVGWDAPAEWGPVEGEPLYDPRTEWEKDRDARWAVLIDAVDGDEEKAVVMLELQNLAIAEGRRVPTLEELIARVDALGPDELHHAAVEAGADVTGTGGRGSPDVIADELRTEVADTPATVALPAEPPPDPR
jgi:hypothetical protein